MISGDEWATGVHIIETVAAAGYDYIELSLYKLTALSGERFARVRSRINASGIACECCNNFFPPAVRITGRDVDAGRAFEYAQRAIDRAASLNVKVIVFGSSGARNITGDFPYDTAVRQVEDMILRINPLCAERAIALALEPISRPESNLITTTAEGLSIVRRINDKNVRLLADYFHLVNAGESCDVITQARDVVGHIHFADPAGRVFPRAPATSAAEFFACLRDAGYAERVSVEAYTNDFEHDAQRAVAILRALTAQTG